MSNLDFANPPFHIIYDRSTRTLGSRLQRIRSQRAPNCNEQISLHQLHSLQC